MKCKHCGEDLYGEEVFCPQCGAPCRDIFHSEDVLNPSKIPEPDKVACPICGEQIHPEDKFCPNCGNSLSSSGEHPQYCPYCKIALPSGAKFCPSCGTQIAARMQKSMEHMGQIPAALERCIELICSYLKNPMETTKNVIKDDKANRVGCIFAAYLLVCGLHLYMFLKACGDSITTFVAEISGIFVAPLYIEVPFLSAFLCGILSGIVTIFLVTAIYYIIARILCKSKSIRTDLYASILSSIIPMIVLLVAAVAFSISISVGLATTVLAYIAWIVWGIIGLSSVVPHLQDGRFWITYLAGILIIVLVNWNVSWRINWLAVRDISVTNGEDRTTIGEIADSTGFQSFDSYLDTVFNGWY